MEPTKPDNVVIFVEDKDVSVAVESCVVIDISVANDALERLFKMSPVLVG